MFLIPALLAILFAAFTLFDWNFMAQVLGYSAYYFILTLFLLWLGLSYRAFQEYRPQLASGLRRYYPGFLSALALCVCVFLSVEISYKVLADETNLLCVSKGMLIEKTVFCANSGKTYYDLFFPIERVLDKRPFLFPFLASILHTFLGYRPENFFVLNFGVLFGILSFAYVFFRWLINPVIGFAAQLLILSQPIITISATSAGLELFTALDFFFCLFLLYHFLKVRTAGSLLLLWINLLLFCHTRYESPVFAGLIFIALLSVGYLKREILWKYRWFYTFTPAFFLPILWQRLLKLEDHEAAPDVQAFGLNNLFAHFQDFAIGQVGTGFQYPYAALVNVVGWIFAIALVSSYVLKKFSLKEKFQRQFVVVVTLCLVTNLLLFLSYHFSDFAHPAAARYFIITSIVISLSPLLYYRLHQAIPPSAFLLYGFIALLIYHPVAIDSQPTHALHKAREYNFAREFLREYPDKRIMIVADRPSFYTVLNYGSVSFNWINENRAKIFHDWYRHLYREILVIQKYRYDTGKPAPGYDLHSDFKLEMITELQNNESEYLRISKVAEPVLLNQATTSQKRATPN